MCGVCNHLAVKHEKLSEAAQSLSLTPPVNTQLHSSPTPPPVSIQGLPVFSPHQRKFLAAIQDDDIATVQTFLTARSVNINLHDSERVGCS